MSIIDGTFSSMDDLMLLAQKAGPAVEEQLEALGLTERQKSILELMGEGMSLADILDLSKDHRDALLAQGIQLLQAGEFEKAREFLTTLNILEPLDERAIYALGTSHQMQGNFTAAAKIYLSFIALDATNPDGFLRLGECFLAAREYANARACFETALVEAERGNGDANSLEHARRMLELIESRMGGESRTGATNSRSE